MSFVHDGLDAGSVQSGRSLGTVREATRFDRDLASNQSHDCRAQQTYVKKLNQQHPATFSHGKERSAGRVIECRDLAEPGGERAGANSCLTLGKPSRLQTWGVTYAMWVFPKDRVLRLGKPESIELIALLAQSSTEPFSLSQLSPGD